MHIITRISQNCLLRMKKDNLEIAYNYFNIFQSNFHKLNIKTFSYTLPTKGSMQFLNTQQTWLLHITLKLEDSLIIL